MFIKKLFTFAKYLCLTIYRSKVLKKFVLGGGVHPPKMLEWLTTLNILNQE